MNRQLPIGLSPLPRRRTLAEMTRANQQRSLALSQMTTQLSVVKEEREMLADVAGALLLCFDSVRLCEIFLSDAETLELTPVFDREVGDALLSGLCSRIEAIPPELRGQPFGSHYIPYLVVPNLLPALGSRGALMSVPLVTGTTLLGLLVVETESLAPDFTLADLDALVSVATQVAPALQRLRSQREPSERARMQQDLELARRIQRSFLPSLAPEMNGFEVAAEYRPAYDVGGDFYDVVSSGRGQITAVVGDVSGKGVAAALVMSRVSSEFHRLATGQVAPHEILGQLNESFISLSLHDTFVTAACVRLDAERRRLTISNAGHLLPLIRRASGEVQPVGVRSSAPVGMVPAETFVDEEFDVGPGDIVLLMTDGVIDALNETGDPLGMRVLLRLIAEAPADVREINRRILAAVSQNGMGMHADDVTLLALRVGDECRFLAA